MREALDKNSKYFDKEFYLYVMFMKILLGLFIISPILVVIPFGIDNPDLVIKYTYQSINNITGIFGIYFTQ